MMDLDNHAVAEHHSACAQDITKQAHRELGYRLSELIALEYQGDILNHMAKRKLVILCSDVRYRH